MGKRYSLAALGTVAAMLLVAVLPGFASPASDELPSRAPWAPAPTDWPAFRNDLGRTGVSPASATMKLAYFKWSYRTGGSRVSSSPAIANVDPTDKNPEIIIGCEDSRLYCLNATSGRLKWRLQTQGPISSSPTVGDINGDGRPEVVVGSSDGRVYAVNGTTGALLWRYATRAAVFASPAIADINGDGRLEIVDGSFDGFLYALRGDGSMLWRATVVFIGDKNTEGIYASPAVADLFNDGKQKVILAAGTGIYVFNGEDGQRESASQGSSPVHLYSTPAVKDLDGNGNPEIITLWTDPPMMHVECITENSSSGTGTRNVTWVRVVSSPAIFDGDMDGSQEAYFGTDSGHVVCVHMNNSRNPIFYDLSIEWSRNITGPVQSSPALADLDGDKKMELVVGSDNRRVVALNAEDGSVSWIYPVPKAVFSSPAVADGDLDGKAEVYFGCYDGGIYALDYNF